MKFGTRRRDRDAVGVERWEWGGGIPLPSRLGSLGERRELPQQGLGRSPGQKRIWGILSVAERLWLKENQVFRETFIPGYTTAHGPLLDISWLK